MMSSISSMPLFDQVELPHRTELVLQDVNVRVASNDEAFVAQVDNFFLPCIRPLAAPSQVKVNVVWVEAVQTPQVTFTQQSKGPLGKRLFFDRQQLFYDNWNRMPDLQLRFYWDGDTFCVDAIYHFNPKKKPYKPIAYLNEQHRARLMRHTIKHPINWFAEHQFQRTLMHASAIDFDGQAVVVAGLAGAGKSTTCLGLLAQPGARFIAENLIGCNHDTAYGFYEPIRLNDQSLAMLQASGEDLPVVHWKKHKGKQHLHVEADRMSVAARIRHLVVPTFSDHTGLVELDPERCFEKLRAINSSAKEVHSFHSYTAPLRYVWAKPGQTLQQDADLMHLLRSVPLYELHIHPDNGVKPVVDVILDALK